MMEPVGGEAEVLAFGGDVLVAKECPEFGDRGSSVDLCDSIRVAKQVGLFSRRPRRKSRQKNAPTSAIRARVGRCRRDGTTARAPA